MPVNTQIAADEDKPFFSGNVEVCWSMSTPLTLWFVSTTNATPTT